MRKKIKRKLKSDFKSFKKNWPDSVRHISFILAVYAVIFCGVFLWHRNNIKEIETAGENTPQKIQAKTLPQNQVQAKGAANWLSFGDSFSSDAYLDKEETTMFLDERMTALIFPPVYTFDQTKDCEDESCGLSGLIPADPNYHEQISQIPPTLTDSNIVYSGLYKLSSKQVACFVVSENGQENVYAYFFDGSNFSPIVTNSTDTKLRTKYGREGGRIAVGGNDDNFVIIYTGYEGLGVHYYNGEVSDISKFLGLRVTDGGFTPYVIKQGEGKKSTWYLLSLDSANPHLVKMWQNDTEEIMGAHDFTYILKGNSDALTAFKPSYQKGKIDFIFKSQAGTYYLKSFIDKGFDNSKDRRAVSVNLNSKQGQISKAIIKSLGLNGQAKIYLGQSLDNFARIEEGQQVRFPEGGSELFWKIIFPRGSKADYSPWLEHINYLDYYFQE